MSRSIHLIINKNILTAQGEPAVEEKPVVDAPIAPNLSLDAETLDIMSRAVHGGGAQDHAFENGHSMKISIMLKSGNGGFLDKSKFPDA
jgi:hypothetical protein